MAGHSLLREHPLKRYFLEELSAGRVSELWWTTEERVNSQVGVIFFSTFHASLLQFPGLTDVRPFTIFSESKRRQGKDISFIFFLVVSQMLVRLQHTWNCEVLLLLLCYSSWSNASYLSTFIRKENLSEVLCKLKRKPKAPSWRVMGFVIAWKVERPFHKQPVHTTDHESQNHRVWMGPKEFI